MENSVCFRDFEERDIDFIYHCKNDQKLNSLIVGQYRPFSIEDAKNWVLGCMGEHETYKFWAIATNDNEKRIIGWASLSEINIQKKTASFHGIVIADKSYEDGFAWIETYRFIFKYVFDVLQLDTLVGANRVEHKQSTLIAHAMYMSDDQLDVENITGTSYNVLHYSISRAVYTQHMAKGDYETFEIINRIIQINKNGKIR